MTLPNNPYKANMSEEEYDYHKTAEENNIREKAAREAYKSLINPTNKEEAVKLISALHEDFEASEYRIIEQSDSVVLFPTGEEEVDKQKWLTMNKSPMALVRPCDVRELIHITRECVLLDISE